MHFHSGPHCNKRSTTTKGDTEKEELQDPRARDDAEHGGLGALGGSGFFFLLFFSLLALHFTLENQDDDIDR